MSLSTVVVNGSYESKHTSLGIWFKNVIDLLGSWFTIKQSLVGVVSFISVSVLKEVLNELSNRSAHQDNRITG